MSVKVELSSTRVVWPKKCVNCGGTSDRQDRLTKTRYHGKGFYILFITYTQETFQLRYPICFKCKIIAKTCRFFYWFLVVPVFIFGLVIFLLSTQGIFSIKMIAAFFIILIIFILAIKLQPLRLKKLNEDGIKLVFKNETIAREFLPMNN